MGKLSKSAERHIDQLLWNCYVMMTDIVLFADNHIPSDTIAGELFNHAVGEGWIPEPPEGNVPLGDWLVPLAYWNEFAERIAFLIEPDASSKTDPAQILDKFQDLHGKGPSVLVRLVTSDVEYGEKRPKMTLGEYDDNVARRIERMKKRTGRNDKSKRYFARLVAQKMAKHDYENFGHVTYKDLLWTVEF